MERFSFKYYAFLLLWVYTETVFGCAFRKLVDENLAQRVKKATTRKSNEVIADRFPPPWSTDKAIQEENIAKWETNVLEEAKKRWDALGIRYKEIDYEGGKALAVSKIGTAPLNTIYRTSLQRIEKEKYDFSILFSPRSLVREWPDEKTNYLVGGSFDGRKNVIHLPFSTVENAALSSTFHHEYLHAIFDYFRESGKNSTFHGAFYFRENPEAAVERTEQEGKGIKLPPPGPKLMWRGTHYTDYMSLEELATFPVNHMLSEQQIPEIKGKTDPHEKSKMARRFVRSVFGHALTNAVNSSNARNALGHILKHNKTGDVRASASIFPKTSSNPWTLITEFNLFNIKYRMTIPEEAIKDLIPELELEHTTNVYEMNDSVKRKIRDIIKKQLEKQYEMTQKAATASRNLVEGLQAYREMGKNVEMTDTDLDKISGLLKATREVTRPYIITKPE